MFNASCIDNYIGLERPLNLEEFFGNSGYKVLSYEHTKGGFTSRCMRVTVVPTNLVSSATIDLHIKWMSRTAKAQKSTYEPIVSKILKNSHIPTPEVLIYIYLRES